MPAYLHTFVDAKRKYVRTYIHAYDMFCYPDIGDIGCFISRTALTVAYAMCARAIMV